VASHIDDPKTPPQYWGMSIGSFISCFFLLLYLASCGANQNIVAPKPSPAASATLISSTTPEVPEKPHQARPIDKPWVNNLPFKTRSSSEQHNGYSPYELSAEYPHLMSPRAGKFNRWIKRKVLRDVARFRRLELRAEPLARKEGKRLTTEALELTFEMYYADDRLISLRLTHRVMAAGQMHPINYYETINYDLVRHRPLRASEIFKRGFLRVFSDYSRAWLRKSYDLPDETWLMEGTEPRARNFPNWNVVPDGVLISFEDYQVSSHNFGQPELIVPYSVLGRLFRRQDLIRHFLVRKSPRSNGVSKSGLS